MSTPIADLTDVFRFLALGWGNATPGASDEETLAWAMEATLAHIATTATEADRARILGWVRDGENARARYEADRGAVGAVDPAALAALDDIAEDARRAGAEMPYPPQHNLRLPNAVNHVVAWQRAWDAACGAILRRHKVGDLPGPMSVRVSGRVRPLAEVIRERRP